MLTLPPTRRQPNFHEDAPPAEERPALLVAERETGRATRTAGVAALLHVVCARR